LELSASRSVNSSQCVTFNSSRRSCTVRSVASKTCACNDSGRPGPVGQPFSQIRIGVLAGTPIMASVFSR